MKKILIIYYSKNGSTKSMSEKISRGVQSVDNVEPIIRTVPEINNAEINDLANKDGVLYATNEDLKNCDGLIIGSPTHFGNMAAPVKIFLDGTTSEWFNGTLCGKPAGVFTSTSSIHGGQETTLITMMIPLLHHGMIILGIPYNEKDLGETTTGGTPYGPSHFAHKNNIELSEHESKLCFSFGVRIAKISKKI